MKIAELMAELVQRQRYAFMCQDEQNNASVRAREKHGHVDNNTHTHRHIRIRRKQDKRDKTEDKIEVTARRKLYSRCKDKSTSQGA